MKLYSSLCMFPVPDMDKTAEFYQTKMGFRRVDYCSCAEPHICLYRGDIEIILTPILTGTAVRPHRELYGCGEDAYFITDTQQELFEEFSRAGVSIAEPVHMTDYHNLEFSVYDCDGRQLIFGQKQWNTADDKIWDELYSRAKSLVHDRQISPLISAGAVAAALVTDKGSIYTGVCIDTASSLGMCAERNAIANMITNGESKIRKVVAVMWDGSVGSPCGACREYMMQLDTDSSSIEFLVDRLSKKTVTLGELLPDWWAHTIMRGQDS